MPEVNEARLKVWMNDTYRVLDHGLAVPPLLIWAQRVQELIAALREAWGRHEIAMGWYKEQFERAARAEAEVGRLRIELGEIKLVLESQDLRLHRYHAVREAAAEIAGSWPVTPEMHKRLIDALAPLVPDEQKASSDAPRSGV